MLKLKKIAVTGGISCGKSRLCAYLEELGAYAVSADKIVHHLLSPDTTLGKKVVELLGPTIIDGGKLDRKRIAELVFRDKPLLRRLESILHPEVFREIEQLYKRDCEKGEYPLFIAEIPLLFEAHGEGRFDTTIAVTSPRELCLKRFLEKGGLSEEEFNRRTELQLPTEKKAELADIVCSNSGTLEELKISAAVIYNQIIPLK